MRVHGVIHQFPREIKFLIIVFVATLSIGYFGGLSFVNDTTNASSKGIQERYLGNEDDEEATKMMFKKSEGEIKTLVHNHILSISVIFFLLAIILSTTSIGMKLKLFLMIEPFVSVVCTFGGIYLMWTGITWMKYIVMVSGFFMTATYILSSFFIVKSILVPKKD